MSTEKTNNTSQEPGTAKNRDEDLVDHAAQCTPLDEWQALDNSLREHRLYVQQLEKIEAPAKTITKAIIEYQKSFINRFRWLEKQTVTEGDLKEYENSLKYIHENLSEKKRDQNCSDVERGREILNECQHDAFFIHIGSRKPYTGFSDGTLHTLSDNAIIGWHPKWKEIFKKDNAK